MKTTANEQTVSKALEKVNKERGYSLIFRRSPEKQGKWTVFTIRSKESGIPGARNSPDGRKQTAASWHAHGFLFDKILELEPDAEIQTAGAKIDAHGGNWKDMEIGSRVAPCYMSETDILSGKE